MIKLAIKHFILESCINKIFNTFITNLKELKYSMKVGDRFSELTIVRTYTKHHETFHFTDIEIIHINYEMMKFRFEQKFIGSDSNEFIEDIRCLTSGPDKEIMVNGKIYYLMNTRTTYKETIIELNEITVLK
jgi:N-formylglutamate amidohydrolase